jgi:SAM-dependent methyltransferase
LIQDTKLRYEVGEYLSVNPDWHAADGPGKALDILHGVQDAVAGGDKRMRRILEVGCGTGAVLAALRQHLPKNVELSGIDIAGAAIAIGKETFPELDLSVKDFLAVEGSFDGIIFCDVLEHLENPFEFLRHAAGLAPVIIVRQPLQGDFGMFRTRGHARANRDLGHIQFFSSESFKAMASTVGWQPSDLRIVAPWELNTSTHRPPMAAKKALAHFARNYASFFSSGFYLNGSLRQGRSWAKS